jgi:hypothetical protein
MRFNSDFLDFSSISPKDSKPVPKGIFAETEKALESMLEGMLDGLILEIKEARDNEESLPPETLAMLYMMGFKIPFKALEDYTDADIYAFKDLAGDLYSPSGEDCFFKDGDCFVMLMPI